MASISSDAELKYDAIESRLTTCVSERMLDLAQLGVGMRVLDIASGRGEPALRAARRVGPTGLVVGVDISQTVVQDARARARREGLENIAFHFLDAERCDEVGADFDVATTRWGLMGMQHPVKALTAIRRALRPSGMLVAALWAERERLHWWSVPRRVTEQFVQLPHVDPNGPGALRYARLERIEADFAQAGFTIEHVEEHQVPVVEAADGSGIADWIRTVLGQWVRDLQPGQTRAWEAELERECEAFRVGSVVQLGGVTRIVVARG